MKIKNIIITLLFLFLTTTPAYAETIYYTNVVDKNETWLSIYHLEYSKFASKAKITFKDMNVDVYYVPYTCYRISDNVQIGGVYDSETKKIFIFNNENPDFTLAHEIGHYYDFEILKTPASYDREEFADDFANKKLGLINPKDGEKFISDNKIWQHDSNGIDRYLRNVVVNDKWTVNLKHY